MEDLFKTDMIYRYLGDSGLKVSVLGFGTWLTAHDAKGEQAIIDCVKKSFEMGVNFFDTAEIYGRGVAEEILGKALKELGCKRRDLVITTKIFQCGEGPNDMFLSRKHITEGLQNSLERMGLEYVDVVFCHRPDDDTPIEETCQAMNWVIEEGLAFYWATSEWPPEKITQAVEVCKKLNYHKPIADQCEYSALVRENHEKNLRSTYENYKYGTTTFSPLAGGILSGKYNDGEVPEGSRYSEHAFAKNVVLKKYFGEKTKENTLRILKGLAEIADELGCTQAQLALAWVIANQDVSTCMFGASRVSQVEDNMKALEVAGNWNEELEEKLDALLDNAPKQNMDFSSWAPKPQRRGIRVDYDMKPLEYKPIIESFQPTNMKKILKEKEESKSA